MRADATLSPLVIDYTNENDILQLFPNGAILSSAQVAWNDLHFGYYRYPPLEIPESCSKQHLVIIFTDVPTDTWLEEITDGRLQCARPRTGDITIVPANIWQSFRWNIEHSYIMLSLNPGVFARRTHELAESESVELVPHFVKPDPLIHGIGLALKTELESDRLGDRLYFDSLVTTLSAHLLRHYSIQKPKPQAYVGGLPKFKLRQVIDYINSYLDQNLTLAELAAVVHVSPSYFSSQFKQSTGLTAHQYVIQTKVARAKQLLLKDELTIAEVAYNLGFAHQSHLNFHFKRLVGVTPKQFLQEQ